MNTIKVFIDLLLFIIKQKLYYLLKFFIITFSYFFKIGLLIAGLLNKVNPDSFIFGVVFFAFGFFLYGDKFKSGAVKKRQI